MKRIFKYFLPFIFSIFPFVAAAKVYINEVAWMGTEKSSYGEWIEFYNDADLEADLNGAGIFEGGGKTLIINLTKKIAPRGYYLIERTTPSTPDPIPEIADDMGSFSGSGLGNSGEFLVLKSADGAVIDSLDASAGWPAGDSATKQTMQRNDSGYWITATATPKALNAIVQNSSGANSSVTTSTEENHDNSGEIIRIDQITYDSFAYSSPFPLSEPVKEKRKTSLDAGRNRIVLADSPVYFAGRLVDDLGKMVSGGSFEWSFGDGNILSGQNVSQVYKAPGEYVVIEKANFEGEELVGRTLIKVVASNFMISGAGKDGADSYIEIENSLPFEANLRGWRLRSYFNTYAFPSDTIILPGKKVRFYSSAMKINLDHKGEIELVSALGKVFSSFVNKESGKIVDNTVDKPENSASSGDKLVDNNWKTGDYLSQLSKMMGVLGEMRNSFVAETAIRKESNPAFEGVKSIILNKELEKFEPSFDEMSATLTSELDTLLATTSAEEKKIVILDAPERKKGFWNFIRSLFGR